MIWLFSVLAALIAIAFLISARNDSRRSFEEALRREKQKKQGSNQKPQKGNTGRKV